MRAAGLSNLIPRWKGDRVNSLKVTGSSGRNMEGWIHSTSDLSTRQQKLIIGLLMEVGILVVMGSHCYEFNGKFFLQVLGGPIGLAITAWVASITITSLTISQFVTLINLFSRRT